jgi:hypothetical protein
MMEFLQAVVPTVLTIAGAVASGTIAVFVPKLVGALAAHTGITLTENQRQTVLDAVQTAAGVLETHLDNSMIRREHINATGAVVREQAGAVLAAVPDSAKAFGLNVPDIARMIVGKVDTANHPPLLAPSVVTPIPPSLPKVPT